MGDVIKFNGLNYADAPPDEILEKAKSWNMEKCIIMGFDENNKHIFGGSFSDAGEMLLLIELTKKFIIDNDFARIP